MTKTALLKSGNAYLIKVMNGMALGLFASLIIGLILKQVGTLVSIPLLVQFGQMAQYCMGAAIGAAVAYALGAPPLGVFSCLICGIIGSNTIAMDGAVAVLKAGEPVGAMVAALVGAEVSKVVNNRTPVNIIVITTATILAGGLVGIYIAPVIAEFMQSLGMLVNSATMLHPFWMGVAVACIMGILLTLPISSAAIAISLSLGGLAAGAATIGCSAHMIGFAVASFRDNGWGGLISQGLGTSMIQVPNVLRKPVIALPAILTSIVLGPVATVGVQLQNNSVGAGMGTSGLVGQLMAIETMGADHTVLILATTMVLPAIVAFAISEFMRKKGYIKPGDMKL